MKLDQKTFLAKFKLYFSNLFARTMKMMLMNAEGLEDNQAIFTNISLDGAEFYIQDPTYYMHLVTFNDKDFIDDLFELFPLLHKAIILIDVSKLLTAINKHEGDITTIKMKHKDSIVFMSTVVNKQPIDTICGDIISEYQGSRYVDIFNSSVVDETNAITKNVSSEINPTDKVSIVTLNDIPPSTSYFRIAVLNSQTTVSVKEINGKLLSNIPYTHSIMADKKGSATRVNFLFNCPLVRVLSVQPSMVWFPKNKNNSKEVNNE